MSPTLGQKPLGLGISQTERAISFYNTPIRALEASLPEPSGRGDRPKEPWQAVTQQRQGLDAEAWTHLRVRDDEQGAVEIERVRCRMQTRIKRKQSGPEAWLIGIRHALTNYRTLEPKVSPDTTDEDTHYRYYYYMSSTCVSENVRN